MVAKKFNYYLRVHLLLLILVIPVKVFSLVPSIGIQFLDIADYEAVSTPFLQDKQMYLGASPMGIGTDIAWKIPGGKGSNVRVIDIESGMNVNHEDLPSLFYTTVPTDSNHGTAVMGIMGAIDNDFGVTGIASEASFGFAGFIEGDEDISKRYIKGIVVQIREATERLSSGDVLVIEQQVTGPKGDYILVEYWGEIFNELKAATDKGIHCIEAAGNGGSDLDSPVYKNLLNRTVRDSGCIVVGAARAGNNRRYSFSNYGKIVDAFGYGGSVAATGYGDLFNGGHDASYTGRFSGTSSATPIVAGAVAILSSIAIEQGKIISPFEMRSALRKMGIAQGKPNKKNIGKFPNVSAMLKHFSLRTE